MSVRIKKSDSTGANVDEIVSGRILTNNQVETIINSKIKVSTSKPDDSTGEEGDIVIVIRDA